jgi:predicted house-cleaning NTP pyrophosphatase (Maf/HAM1 superfamily)
MATPPRLILGSQSVGRRQCLQSAGYAFEAMAADIEEKAVRIAGDLGPRSAADPSRLTLAIARAKADKLMQSLRGQDRILITGGEDEE